MIKHPGYVAVFFYQEDDFGTQLLLQKKDRGWRGIDLWTPFGGQIEEGEEPMTCIQREVLEELGVTILGTQLQFYKQLSTTTKSGDMVPLHYFSAQFIWPINTIRLGEGCGFAFWYADELATVPMQAHEKLIAEEILNTLQNQE